MEKNNNQLDECKNELLEYNRLIYRTTLEDNIWYDYVRESSKIRLFDDYESMILAVVNRTNRKECLCCIYIPLQIHYCLSWRSPIRAERAVLQSANGIIVVHIWNSKEKGKGFGTSSLKDFSITCEKMKFDLCLNGPYSKATKRVLEKLGTFEKLDYFYLRQNLIDNKRYKQAVLFSWNVLRSGNIRSCSFENEKKEEFGKQTTTIQYQSKKIINTTTMFSILPRQNNFERAQQVILDVLNGDNDSIRQYQKDATLRVKQHFEQNRKALVVLPTGCGKTGVIVLSAYACACRRILILTPSEEITNQIVRAFTDDNESFLVQRFDESARNILPTCMTIYIRDQVLSQEIVVTNVHKLRLENQNGSRRGPIDLDRIPINQFSHVFIDEAHHFPAPLWNNIVQHFVNSKVLFLTATPTHQNQRLDSIDPEINQVYQLTRDDAVRMNFIRPLQFDCMDDNLDIHVSISKRIIYHLNNHDSIDNRHKHQAMVITRNVDESHQFVETFRSIEDNRFTINAYVGNTSEVVRQEFCNGNIHVLVVVGRLLEGFDHSNISVVAICRNLKSKVRMNQFIGRAVRKLSDEPNINAVVVWHAKFQDVADTINNMETFASDLEEDDEM